MPMSAAIKELSKKLHVPKLGATDSERTLLLARPAVLATFCFGIAVRGAVSSTALRRRVAAESGDLPYVNVYP